MVCLLSVPRDQARAWLRGSGCHGLFLRPFWTKDTGRSVQRDQFALHWLRGHGKDADRIWAALKEEPGFFGLLAGGPDVAVRLSSEAQVQRALQQVRFALKVEVAFRRANPEARWWKLGPLTQAEAMHVRNLIPQFGLRMETDQLRFGAAGPFRSVAYFMASGLPTRRSLDDGSWSASQMELKPADPPPRKEPPRASAPISRLGTTGVQRDQRPALPPQSTWGGVRQLAPGAPSPSAGVPRTGVELQPDPRRAPAVSSKPRAGSAPQKAAKSRVRADASPVEDRAKPMEEQLGLLLRQMEALSTQNALMVQELAELRRENVLLRRRLEEVSGLVHQPCASAQSLSWVCLPVQPV